ncbi:hypothetical protein [Mesobacillus subterraneus]|uniref:Uncharacterized protein n=1 Tax=Mesobacillus subterraneus TaxID=285983 RepID=A0A427TSZ7_9BACI|nr:hypothetical protein [Mesobacillus subterraneus]RSD27546.1 hypothetical protein EJA10_09260 [Mesobacillus subterraneus]
MTRKLVVCGGIFLSLLAGFTILDNMDEKELSRKGTDADPGLLRVQQTELDEVETAKSILPFGSREYVRIVPR